MTRPGNQACIYPVAAYWLLVLAIADDTTMILPLVIATIIRLPPQLLLRLTTTYSDYSDYSDYCDCSIDDSLASKQRQGKAKAKA